MLRILGTIFAALLGLAFGSFLNVCLSRWPAEESIVSPHSHCRTCSRTLMWWENIPLFSWLALRGRCRTCRALIGWRYTLAEGSLGVLDAENLWLPDFLTIPGIALGLLFRTAEKILGNHYFRPPPLGIILLNVEYILAAAGIILLIRGVYWLIRRQEGIGLGDAKLMAMLAAWLGFPGTILAFFL